MIILGIETSGRRGSVAVCEDGRPLASYAFPEGGRRARDIISAIDHVVAQARLDRRDVRAVAVSEGPGSFTGLRVGVACAKTLAFALGWRCAAVPSLEVKAQNVEPDRHDCRWTCPVLDARRGRVYGTLFRRAEGWEDTTGVLCVRPGELAERLPEGTLVFGDGVRAHPEVFSENRLRTGPEHLAAGRAEAVARLGAERIRRGLDVDPVQLVPRYYRLTAPEEKLGPPAADQDSR